MKLVFTPEAARQASAMNDWWREHREKARDLFERELLEAQALIADTPTIGSKYTTRTGKTVRRVLLPKTRNHVYFDIDGANDVVVVLAVWGAPRGRPPRL